MIRERLLLLRERRAVLIAHAEDQRTSVDSIVRRVERATAWIEKVKSVGRTLRAHPLWVVAGLALVAAARPRGVFKMAAAGFSLWRGWRRVSVLLDQLASRPAPRRASY